MATRQYGAPIRVERALLAAAPILPALERIEIITRMARAEGVPLQLRRMTMLSQARGGSRSCNLGETFACAQPRNSRHSFQRSRTDTLLKSILGCVLSIC